ncbi:GAF domain-containing protein [Candidatus Riflebacteria bacterium]
MQLVQQLGMVVTSQLDIRELNKVLLDILCKIVKAERGFLYLQKGNELNVIRHKSIKSEKLFESSFTTKWKRLQTIFPRVFMSHRDFLEKTEISINRKKIKKGRLIYSPIEEIDEISGFILLFRERDEEPFTFNELEIMRSLSSYTSIAVRNAVKFKASYLFYTELLKILWENLKKTGDAKKHAGKIARQFMEFIQLVDFPKNYERDFLKLLTELFPGNPFLPGNTGFS